MFAVDGVILQHPKAPLPPKTNSVMAVQHRDLYVQALTSGR